MHRHYSPICCSRGFKLLARGPLIALTSSLQLHVDDHFSCFLKIYFYIYFQLFCLFAQKNNLVFTLKENNSVTASRTVVLSSVIYSIIMLNKEYISYNICLFSCVEW